MSPGRMRLLGVMGAQEYWDAVNGRQTELVRALKPFPGCFMQRSDWCGDVWGEVISVYEDSVTICDDGRPQIVYFYQLRGRVEATPPLDSRIIFIPASLRHNLSTGLKTNTFKSAVEQWKDTMIFRVMVA